MPICQLPHTLLMQRMGLGLAVGLVVPFSQQHKRQKYWSKKNKMQNININPPKNRQKKEVKGVRWENKHGQMFLVPTLTFRNEHQDRTEDPKQVRQTCCRILTGVALEIPHCPKQVRVFLNVTIHPQAAKDFLYYLHETFRNTSIPNQNKAFSNQWPWEITIYKAFFI